MVLITYTGTTYNGKKATELIYETFRKITKIPTDAFFPGKLKNSSGPYRCGIDLSTFSNLTEFFPYLILNQFQFNLTE